MFHSCGSAAAKNAFSVACLLGLLAVSAHAVPQSVTGSDPVQEPVQAAPGDVQLEAKGKASRPSGGVTPFSNKALGDPFGARSWLFDHGIDLTLTYLTETLANVAGGRRSGIAYDHQITMGVDVNLQKLIGAKGLSFRMLGVQRAGRDVAKNYVGNLTLRGGPHFSDRAISYHLA